MAGHQDRLLRGKAGHNIFLAPSHGSVLSRRRERPAGRIRDQEITECSTPCYVVLSVTPTQSFCKLILGVCRMGDSYQAWLDTVLLHSCWGTAVSSMVAGFPAGVFLRPSVVKRGVNLDLKSPSRDNSRGSSPCPSISSEWLWASTINHCLQSPGCQPGFLTTPGVSGVF